MTTDIVQNLSNPHWWVEQCTEDLYVLCRNMLQTLEDPTPGFKDLYEPTHRALCTFLDNYAIEGERCMILMPRNWLKSYIITVGWTIQRMMRNWLEGKRETIIISNATIDNAKEFLARIKYNFQYNDFFRYCLSSINKDLARQLSDPENEAERWTKDEIQINGCRIETGGVEGNLVSRHYKIMINDDLVNWDNSRTKDQLLKTKDWWRLARSLLLPDGIEFIIGTRWSFDDIYGHVIDRFLNPGRDYHKGKPIVELHKEHFHLFQVDCWGDTEKLCDSTFPIMFPDEKLNQLKKEQENEFYGQYRNDPMAKGRHKFLPEYFSYYVLSDIPRIVNTVMLLDVTDKEKVKSDYTGMVIADIGVDKIVYIRMAERRKITDANLIDWVIEEACKWSPSTIGIESMKYNTLVELLELLIPRKFEMGEILKEHREYVKTLPFIIYECKHRGRPKEVRIENMSGFVQKEKILFPRKGADNLIDELIRLGSSTMDDTADAFGYLQDVLVYPKHNDPPKTYLVPEELRKTAEQREQEEWQNIKDNLESSERDIFDEPIDMY